MKTVWTAKRVLILFIGLLVSLSSHAIYALFLGGIDGLQPLPIEMQPLRGPEEPPPPGGSGDLAVKKLEESFGIGCDEKRRPIRLWAPEKGIALAAGMFEISKEQKDRVELRPFSVAMFHKSKAPGAFPEISTIRSDVAYVTLDKPVSQASELANRKVIAVELQGRQPGISLVNNRRTAEKSDDVDILITNGSLFYEESRNLIWTDGVVRMKDHQTNPPTTLRGKGLDMTLSKDSSPNRARGSAKLQTANKKHNDNGGIERIVLRSDVEMFFRISASSGFLTGSQDHQKLAEKATNPQRGDQLPQEKKADIHIHTGGKFVYDLTKEMAWFESPPPRETKKNEVDQLAPDQVHVQRTQVVDGTQKYDQLTCDQLDLQFRRKADGTAGHTASPGSDKEIETAKATARAGNEVVMALDSERMAAYGSYLYFRNADAHNGPHTVLKGESLKPLRTVKDGHKMVCMELYLTGANKNGDGQSAIAIGPGQIDFLDGRNPEKAIYSTHVIWNDRLTMDKDREGAKIFDLMVVNGKASFIDDQQKQQLHGEKISVWLENTNGNQSALKASGTGKQRLHRVVAQDHVRGSSPEFIIRQTNRLTMSFVPELARDERLPELPKYEETKKGQSPPLPPTEEAKKPSPPLELQGNEITVAVATLGTKKQLQELIAKGNVFVFQAGDLPGEKRVDIQGQLLTVKHAEKGDTLIVYGDPKKLARLELGEMILWGPLVTINQADNRADVDGAGAMEMPSNTNLDGTKPSKGANRVTIHWNKNMTFDGKVADFYGGTQAFQNDGLSKVQCQTLTATLDQTVPFTRQTKKSPAAKIDRILCDGKVFIDDIKLDEKREQKQHTVLQGQELFMDNLDEGRTTLSGPGLVRLLAKGSSDIGLAPQPGAVGVPANNKQGKMEWKLTRIGFQSRMWSKTKGNNKIAKFFDNIEVFHFLSTDINAVMNPDQPPKDSFYLRSDILSIASRQNANTTTQLMIAERNVFFKTDKYLGNADILNYDESTDIIIFEGTNGNFVKLWEIKPNGLQPVSVTSSKVLYNRRTGLLESTSVRSFTN